MADTIAFARGPNSGSKQAVDTRLLIDSGVLLLYFFLIIFIGLYMGRKEDNLEDFALGGMDLPMYPSQFFDAHAAGSFSGPARSRSRAALP